MAIRRLLLAMGVARHALGDDRHSVGRRGRRDRPSDEAYEREDR